LGTLPPYTGDLRLLKPLYERWVGGNIYLIELENTLEQDYGLSFEEADSVAMDWCYGRNTEIFGHWVITERGMHFEWNEGL